MSSVSVGHSLFKEGRLGCRERASAVDSLLIGAKSGCLCRFWGSHFVYDQVQWTVAAIDWSTYWDDLEFRNLGYIVFVINTISKKVTKVAQGSLQSISCSLLLCFLKSCSFAFAIFDMSVPNVLMHFSIREQSHIRLRKITSWNVPSRSVTLTTTDRPRLTFPVL